MQTIAYKLKAAKGKAQLILVESAGKGNVPRNAARASVLRAAQKFEAHIDPIKLLAKSIFSRLREINNPGSITVEFGIELGLEAGIPLITQGTGKGNFKVTIEWKNP